MQTKNLKRKGFTLVECRLETGRTHQIRVHMKYIGHPLVGDIVYGPRKVIGTTGQFLHAKTIGFIHPFTQEYMEFSHDLPSYFIDKIEELSNLNLNKRQCSLLKNEIKKIHDEIVNGRRQTLPKEGEYGSANIVFKVLRRSGHLQKMKEIKTRLFDKINSL